jgi:hypothetical protein
MHAGRSVGQETEGQAAYTQWSMGAVFYTLLIVNVPHSNQMYLVNMYIHYFSWHGSQDVARIAAMIL